MLAALLPKSIADVLHVPFSQLTDGQLDGILSDFGMGAAHPELRDAAIQLLKGKGVDNAADAIRHPEAIKSLVDLVKNFAKSPPQRSCDFCGGKIVQSGQLSSCQQCGIIH